MSSILANYLGRNNQSVVALSKITLASDVPVGLNEDIYSPLACNFGTPREEEVGRCLYMHPSVTISVSAADGDISLVTALDHNGDIITLVSVFVTDKYVIFSPSGDRCFNIKCWATGYAPTSADKSSLKGDLSNIFAWWNGDDSAGTVIHDSSGKGNHGTLADTTETIHVEDLNVPYSFLNTDGYRLGAGGVKIPKDRSLPDKNLDVFGNDLTNKGVAPSSSTFVQSPCWEYQPGSYYSVPGIKTTDSVYIYGKGNTPTIPVDGQLHLNGVGEKAYFVFIYRGSTQLSVLTFSEKIIDPLTHQSFNVLGEPGYHATLVGGTFGNQGTQDDFHWTQKGFTIGNVVNGAPQGHIIPAHGAIANQDALGNDLQFKQDGHSFIDNNTSIQISPSPSAVLHDTDNSFIGAGNVPIVMSFADVIAKGDNSKIFVTSSGKHISSIVMHKQPLTGRQLEIEKRIRGVS